jgi:RHS repeat-associated protein
VRHVVGLRRIAQVRVGAGPGGADEVRYFVHDALGTTRALVDEAGALTDTYEYEAYGALLEHVGETECEWLYTGEQWDLDLGLVYLRARWMDPATGRFVSRDAFEGDLGRPTTRQPYEYGELDPTRYVDPTGNYSLAEVGVAAAVLGVVFAMIPTATALDERVYGPAGPDSDVYLHVRSLPIRLTHTRRS